MNINSNDVRGMQTLALQSCVSATIPMGIYEGMDTEDSAGHIASMLFILKVSRTVLCGMVLVFWS